MGASRTTTGLRASRTTVGYCVLRTRVVTGDRRLVRRLSSKRRRAWPFDIDVRVTSRWGPERRVLEHAGLVLDQLDAAVEGAVLDHLEGDVRIAVIDAFLPPWPR
jgi:hypothetical protein